MTNSSEVVVKLPEEGDRYLVVGGRYITIKATGAETGGAYGMWEVLKLPGEGVPLHSHSYEDESWYVLEGELEFVIGERTVRALAGTRSAHAERRSERSVPLYKNACRPYVGQRMSLVGG